MDPNACLQRFIGALIDNDSTEAYDAHLDLSTWLRNGGFAPDWKPWEKGAFEGYVRLDRFTSIGGYPLAYLRNHKCVCAGCASLLGCKPEDCGVHWEGESLECDECGEPIESAYGNPSTEEIEADLEERVMEEIADDRKAEDWEAHRE